MRPGGQGLVRLEPPAASEEGGSAQAHSCPDVGPSGKPQKLNMNTIVNFHGPMFKIGKEGVLPWREEDTSQTKVNV